MIITKDDLKELAKLKQKRRYKATSGYNVYLKLNSSNKVLLPVSPEVITKNSPFGANTVKVAHKGEVTRAGFRELQTYELSSFFPKTYNATYCTHKFTKSPTQFAKTIESYRSKRKPIQFIVPKLNISVKVLITDFDREFKGGEVGDIYYSLKMVEYREMPSTKIKSKKKTTATSSKKKKTTKSTGKKTTRASSSKNSVKKGQTHTVKKNETLQKISQKYYSTTSKWKEIYELNRKKIGANPNKIYVGQKLVIRKK